MKYRRMPIEIESPEQIGYGNIRCNLTESSVTDLRLDELGLELGSLPPGAWRVVTPEELRKAFPGYVTTGRP